MAANSTSNLASRAIWYIESNSRGDLSLESIAEVCGVSPYHLTRCFHILTGLPLMRYVRRRRLSQAAEKLAAGAPDILQLALDAGYNSHEAFSRAFKSQFGKSPEAYRASEEETRSGIMEVAKVETTGQNIAHPRFEIAAARRFMGIRKRYDMEDPSGIPDQWQHFVGHLGSISNQVGTSTYGLIMNVDPEGTFEYMSAVQVREGATAQDGLETVDLEGQRYAVFQHTDHVSTIRHTMGWIWNEWLPNSGYNPPEAPSMEVYGTNFDPITGSGGFEVWIPVTKK